MLCGWREGASGPLWSLLAKTETSTFLQAPGVCPRQARPCSHKFTSYRTKEPLEVVLYHSPFRGGQGTQVLGRLSPDHPVGYGKARLPPRTPHSQCSFYLSTQLRSDSDPVTGGDSWYPWKLASAP